VSAVTIGDRAETDLWLGRSDDAARAAGTMFAEFLLSIDHNFMAMLDGDLERAEAAAESGAAIAEELHEDVAGLYGGQLFLIRREQDRLRELVPVLRLLMSDQPEESMWQPGLVLMLAEAGLREEALTRLEHLAANRCAAVPRDDLYPGVLAFLAEAAFLIRARHVVTDLSAELAQWDTAIMSGHAFGYVGSVRRYKGLLAELDERLEEATAHFEAAVAFERQLDVPISLAHALVDCARAKQRLGESAAARAHAGEAALIADRHGLIAVRRQIDELRML